MLPTPIHHPCFPHRSSHLLISRVCPSNPDIPHPQKDEGPGRTTLCSRKASKNATSRPATFGLKPATVFLTPDASTILVKSSGAHQRSCFILLVSVPHQLIASDHVLLTRVLGSSVLATLVLFSRKWTHRHEESDSRRRWRARHNIFQRFCSEICNASQIARPLQPSDS